MFYSEHLSLYYDPVSLSFLYFVIMERIFSHELELESHKKRELLFQWKAQIYLAPEMSSRTT